MRMNDLIEGTNRNRYKLSTEYARFQNPNNLIEINLSLNSNFSKQLKDGDYVYLTVNDVKGSPSNPILCVISENNKLGFQEIAIEDYLFNKILEKVRLSRTKINRQLFNSQDYSLTMEKALQLKTNLSGRKMAGHSTDKTLLLAKDIYEQVKNQAELLEKDKKLRNKRVVVRLINQYSNAYFDYKLSEVKPADLGKGQFVINFYHRELMNLRNPMFISSKNFEKLTQNLKKENLDKENLDKKIGILDDTYINDGTSYRVIKQDFDSTQKNELLGALKASGYFNLTIVLYKVGINKSNILKKGYKVLTNKVLELLIGYREIELKAVRPYPIDETTNIARLSYNSMKMLGIEESDKITVTYNNNSKVMRALSFNDIKATKQVNIIMEEFELDYWIGISGANRRELELPDINCVVKVKRDMSSIFWKKSHVQILPIIGVLITIIQLVKDPLMQKILLCIFTMITIYIMLSEEREKTANKK
jgi:hypothetical protein